MRHGDQVAAISEQFQPLAKTSTCPYAAIVHRDLPVYGMQFHPEVTHTPLGGTVLANTAALHLAATIPDGNCHAVWACQDMITKDITGGRGPRNIDGHLHLPETPGLGVQPDENTLGDPE